MGFYKPCQGRDLGAVETIRGFGKIGEGAAARGQRGKGAIVARKTGAAIADRALQILGADPRIESQRVGNHADIGFGKFLAQAGKHIGIADFGGDVRVDRQLGDFRVNEIHARYRGRVLASPRVDIRKKIPSARIGLADQKKIGIIEIADHRPECDKFGTVAQPEVLAAALAAGAFERGLDFAAGGTRHHRAGKHHEMIGIFVAQRAADGFASGNGVPK